MIFPTIHNLMYSTDIQGKMKVVADTVCFPGNRDGLICAEVDTAKTCYGDSGGFMGLIDYTTYT